MKIKTKLAGIIIILVLILSAFISTLQASEATTKENQHSIQKENNNFSAQASAENIDIENHKITASELDKLKSQVGVYQEGQNYNQVVKGHGTGLKPPTTDEWKDLSNTASVIDNISYPNTPSNIDNSKSPYFPPIGNQGSQGSCATWAVGYYTKTFQEAREHGWVISNGPSNEIMSPSFLYNLINHGTDGGSYIGDVIQLIDGIGVCSLSKMPYNAADYKSWPSEQAWQEAALYRGNQDSSNIMYLENNDELSSLKSWLASGNLAVISVDSSKIQDQTWGWSLLTNNDMLTLDNYNNPQTNHAVTIVGYDDNFSYTEQGQTNYGAFKIANSWGISGLPSPFSWEHILDGCFWISYKAIEQQVAYCYVFNDKINYNPEILATFRVNHSIRSDCDITIGVGTPTSPIISKRFNDFVFGGAFPFCSNNIVFDITEFKGFVSSLYNQPFFMTIYDRGTSTGGTNSNGTITYFGIGNVSSTQTPIQTINNNNVNLALTYSLTSPTLSLSITNGPPLSSITLNCVGFTEGSSANISYLNPLNSSWILINNNLVTASGNFSYTVNAPDLLQSNPAGDNPHLFNNIVLRVQGISNNRPYTTTSSFAEWRRGLTQIGSAVAVGLYGNNSNVASTAFVQSGLPMIVTGNWFSPGNTTLFWDTTISLGTVAIEGTGLLNATVPVPVAFVGQHTLTINDGSTIFCVNLSRVPIVSNDYVDSWHTSNFTINLTPDNAVNETFYRINDGVIYNVTFNGQPKIGIEGGNNKLEYWSKWNFNQTTLIDIPHTTLTGLKLDSTVPTGTITPTSSQVSIQTVTLSLSSTDAVSGIAKMCFSNDNNTWSNWEPYATLKTWTLPSGDGQKNVYVQYMDNAGLASTYSCAITLQTPTPTPSPTQSTTQSPTSSPIPASVPSQTPQAPEIDIQMFLILLGTVTVTLAAVFKRKHN